jgi:hypothetical protein
VLPASRYARVQLPDFAAGKPQTSFSDVHEIHLAKRIPHQTARRMARIRE